MNSYILRKEYFGGILSDVKRFSVDEVNMVQFEALKEFVDIKGDTSVVVFDNHVYRGMLTAPISVTIYPSLRCNSDCEFCFVKPISHKYKTDMTYYEFCCCVDKLHSAGVVDIEIMGGEPFMVPWVIDGIQYISSKGMHCSINTNAILLGNKMIERLADVDNLSLRISIQDDFDSLPEFVLKLFDDCKEHKIRIDVLSVLQKRNYDKLIYLVDKLPKEIVKNFIILYNNPPLGVYPEYSTKEFYSITTKILDYSRKKGHINVVAKGPFGHCYKERKNSEFLKFYDGRCLACVSRFEIMPNGDVLPCVKYYPEDDSCIGNMLVEEVETIWFGEKAQHFREKIEHYNNISCTNCSWSGFCSGCVGYAEGLNLHKDDRCPRRELP